MISRSDFKFTHKQGISPYTEEIRMRLTIGADMEIDLRHQEGGSLDLRAIAEEKLVTQGMRQLYGDLDREIQNLRRTVKDNCGLGEDRDAIDGAFRKVFAMLHGEHPTEPGTRGRP